MKDNEGREIEYLRISVTDRCNLRCVYCMPESGVKHIGHPSILTYEEIVRVCKAFAKHGLKHIKITGGEPLVRKGVTDLIADLKKIPGIDTVTITTNGVLLEDYYDALAAAGVDAITVSLDTMKPDVFREITRRDELDRVLAGIQKAIKENKVRFKLNCVPFLGIERQEILSLLEYARENDVDVRFIEMMPMGFGKDFSSVPESEIRKKIEEQYGEMTICHEKRGNGPATYYQIPGFKGKIGFISAVSHKFCSTCNRVRMTSDGYLKTCLQYETGVDLKPLLRGDVSEAELWEVMSEAIRQKPKAHHFEEMNRRVDDELRGMSQIGG